MRPKTVTEYIATVKNADARKKLREMRAIFRKAAPGAVEGIKWGMPSLSFHRILINYAAFKDHVSIFPTPSAIGAFKKQLAPYVVSKGTIQFPLGKPLPVGLLRKIAAHRVKELRTEDKKWRA